MYLVTAFYAGLLALAYASLSVIVIRTRHRRSISLGHGDCAEMEHRMRAHGNFAEYIPLALLLLGLLEAQRAPWWLLHGLGVTLLLGRVLHASAFLRNQGRGNTRVAGMALTLNSICVSALALLYYAGASMLRS